MSECHPQEREVVEVQLKTAVNLINAAPKDGDIDRAASLCGETRDVYQRCPDDPIILELWIAASGNLVNAFGSIGSLDRASALIQEMHSGAAQMPLGHTVHRIVGSCAFNLLQESLVRMNRQVAAKALDHLRIASTRSLDFNLMSLRTASNLRFEERFGKS